jgi:triacylglycerol lipase
VSLERVRGLKALIHDAIAFTVDRVEQGQTFVADRARQVVDLIAPELTPIVDDVELLSSAVPLATIRSLNRLIEWSTDPIADLIALGPWLKEPRGPIPMRSDLVGTEAWLADGAIAALNGAVGDYLHRQKNGLEIGFLLRHGDEYVSPETFVPPSRRIAVFVHGLAASEWSWCWNAAEYHGDPGACFGTLLERDLGFVPIFARYNTGRRVFENGRLLADALEGFFLRDPPAVDEIILAGHSMGGLVVRSACHHADRTGQQWVKHVSRSFSFAVPHRGAPLEKAGHLLTGVLESVGHPGAQIPAEILRRRSAGIRDLRLGTLTDDQPIDEEVPLLDHITHHFVSATVTKDRDHPLGQLFGDVLVRVPSASGPIATPATFPIETECFGGIFHHQLQNHPDVYAWMLRAITRTT